MAAGSAAIAETGPSDLRHAGAQAAGITALHLCTGYFATEAPRALIDGTLATNGNPAAPLDANVTVDGQEKTVSVRFASDMPPRIAVARPTLGCAMLPIGATKDFAHSLLRPALSAPDLDDRRWPMGDVDALARLPVRRRQAVERVIDEAFKDEPGAYGGITWGVVIVKDGRIAAERYQHGFAPHIAARTNSMCKSLGGTLIGVGVEKGLLDLHRKAPLTEWRRPGDPRGAITIDDLLHMGSGLYSDGAQDPSREIYRSGAAIAEIAALNQMNWKPGSRFVYAGTDVNLAVRALREAINDDAAYPAFPYRELLWKIGMTRTTLETDWNNDFIVSGQCWSTARDFGRLGLLYLADGVWRGERILPAGWSAYVSTPAPAQPPKGSIGGDAGYGAQFWLHGGMEGLPPVAYAAFGARGQYAVIVPSQDLVVVRRGFDGASAFKIQTFAADVIRALQK
ncbi:serine hydrolase [Sphingomonas sp. BIUV-7]|uniref:Serine hydrolase n=1 Tax=Sphingomonas natans TaxID=3063330 RepID=A0ABT8Y7S0_9SPHN|nr:serine hydrolase [Sphingomonas sp. BIUV-7]MDO6414057.1 serine hydrolase [Sphingomonas sp. BIUV-7]